MEKYPKVEPELSFLQLLSNDQPANAPEVNTAASSHNLNSGQAGLQVIMCTRILLLDTDHST